MAAPPKTLFLTRQVEFCAAHRLYRDDWTPERNRELFGKCANDFGHGHNYLLEATFAGEPDRETGMVVHFNFLKRLLDELVVEPLDHRNLNHDVALMKGVLPTSENLLLRLWDTLSAAIEGRPFRLCKLRLRSSTNNWVEYLG